MRQAFGLLTLLAAAGTLCGRVESQTAPYAPGPSLTLNKAEATITTDTVSTTPGVVIEYQRPTQRTQADNFVFDAFGPYPIAGSLLAAGLNQFTNSPPEWHQGVAGYSKRFGSNFGIAGVATATRYGLSEAFKEDSLYYRCDCAGVFPRVRHALLSTLTARRGDDGHRVFSVPALIAPYAGTMTAVYGWYPDRFGAKDAFRMGNYSMLVYAGANLSLEFLYSGPHSLLSRMRLNNPHGALNPGALNPGPNHTPEAGSTP